MRNKIRVYGLIVTACILILSITGCAGVPAGNTDPTPGPSQSPAASNEPGESGNPGESQAPPAPGPAQPAYRPVIEEELSEAALDAWLDFKIKVADNTNPSFLRDFIRSSFSVVPPEAADAMVWQYINILRDYLDTMNRYLLGDDIREALLNAYQSDGTFDSSMLDEGQNNFVDETEAREIGWVVLEGMIEPRIRYDRIAEWTGPVSPMMGEYVDLLAEDVSDPPAVDGALQIGYQALEERTLRIEELLGSAIGSPYQSDVEDLYVRYLDLFLSGADTPSVLDIDRYYESDILAMNPEAEAAFQQVLDTRPDSATAAAVADWWGYLSGLIESGASGETVYQQIWDGFFTRLDEYAAAAGVRVPRLFFTVSTDEIDDDIFKAKIEYPLFYGEGVPDGALSKVENWITADIQKGRDEVRDMSAPDHDLAADDGYELPPYGFYANLRLAQEAGPVASVVADMEQYTGGAHGMPYRIGYNFDPMTGEQVAIADLFQEGADPWALLGEDITRQITLLQERYSETGGDTGYLPYNEYAGLSEPHEWYVTDEGITVIFQAYEIGPYAMGLPEFTVPWWRLADYLK